MLKKSMQIVIGLLLAIALTACSSTTGRSAGRTIDDAAITASVKAKLASDKASTLASVDVDTVRGTVYLTGIAPDRVSKQRATELARQVDGVNRVVNNLQTKTAAGDSPRDRDRTRD